MAELDWILSGVDDRYVVKPGYYRIYYDTALLVLDSVFQPKPGILKGLIVILGYLTLA